MIRLSPKALRFADRAADAYIRAAPAAERDIWARWQANPDRSGTARTTTEPDGRIGVPDTIALILLTAVEEKIRALRDQCEVEGDEDGDVGNDLAFLGSVQSALVNGLEHRHG